MKKKMLGLMLAVLVAMPIFVNAEEASVKMGGKTYATLKEAVEATESCEGICENVTTITVLKDSETPGIIFESGKNLVIDFAGHKISFTAPTVGSAGTQTIDMQILKNSNIVLKNGTIQSSNTEKSKVVIQNYANLTLTDMTILATNELNMYGVSNNSGTVNILGNTSIKTAAVAFDVYGYYKGGYPNGPQVTVDTTGTIEGKIEVSVDKGTATKELSLVIKNINHIGEIYIQPGQEKNVTIEAGNYTDENVVEKLPIEEGKEVFETINSNGETEYVVATEQEVEKAPYTEFAISGEDFVKGLEEAEKNENLTEEDKLLLKEIKEILKDKLVASVEDIYYGSFIGDNYIINSDVSELEKAVEVFMEIPENLKELAKGFTRKYTVIRVHYNATDDKYEIDELEAKDNGDGTITFETDKFSTYILTYSDVKTELPAKTGDINLIMLIGGIIVAIGGIVVSTKKRLENNI